MCSRKFRDEHCLYLLLEDIFFIFEATRMANLIDASIILSILLLCLFSIGVWSFQILAILRSQQELDHIHTDLLFASLAILSSPAILLLHICIHILSKISRLFQFILLSFLILLILLVSPAFLPVILLVYILYKLLRLATPLGNRIYNLTLEFYDRLDVQFTRKKPGQVYERLD
jgi:hypothetical protein